MSTHKHAPPGGETLHVAAGILAESMTRPVRSVDEQAFDRALDAYHREYGEAYTASSRHALDETDRREAHDEAVHVALEAFLATYLDETEQAA